MRIFPAFLTRPWAKLPEPLWGIALALPMRRAALAVSTTNWRGQPTTSTVPVQCLG